MVVGCKKQKPAAGLEADSGFRVCYMSLKLRLIPRYQSPLARTTTTTGRADATTTTHAVDGETAGCLREMAVDRPLAGGEAVFRCGMIAHKKYLDGEVINNS